jgi:glutamate-5-semialdehyde dehydrogenase
LKEITSELKNQVLRDTAAILAQEKDSILEANAADMEAFGGTDLALRDRLEVDDKKIDAMISALNEVADAEDPVGRVLYHLDHPNGMTVENRTCPFGSILIIYESRPDVTIEAAAIAFKSGNKIALKGGKEALCTNLRLYDCWQAGLRQNGIPADFIRYLNLSREETQQLLSRAEGQFDLIVPRGGDALIRFVKQYASCPVIVSGRGNNFLYVHKSADKAMALNVIMNGKTSKISACNALDKVLIDSYLPHKEAFITELIAELIHAGVEVRTLENRPYPDTVPVKASERFTEYLDHIILLEEVHDTESAIQHINAYSGHHSAVIITEDEKAATGFMEGVDAAAVYHNASSRFTDGGMLGLGAELAISTDKLHHRGPLGTAHLVSNKWYIKGYGQIR